MSSIPWSSEALRAIGPQRAFTGESLGEIAFPLGGIGTGTVSLGGRGQLRDWEIFNHPGKGKDLPYTFFALRVAQRGRETIARVLERRLMPPYSAGFGLSTGRVSGLPRLREATYRGEYPFAWIDFEDDEVPLEIHLEAFNPFIPMNEKDSGLPLARFDWLLTNMSDRPVEAAVAFSVLNAAGYDGRAGLGNRGSSMFGKNRNTWRAEDGLRGVLMTTQKYPADAPQFGTMAVATDWQDTACKLRWERAGWWDDVQNFWDEFVGGEAGWVSGAGVPELPDGRPSPEGQTDVTTLCLRAELAPGASVTLPFTLAWHFPNLTNTWNSEPAVKGQPLGNWYARVWSDAWDAARYAITNQQRLDAGTRAYHAALFGSTLPTVVIDAAASNASILRTPTVLRTADGRMNAFEGCGDSDGCCPMNCTHVWNYVQTVAHLFPALERSVRLTDFRHNTRGDGDMAFRTLLPLVDTLWIFKPAADGQTGTVMKAYREWLQSGDRAFLESIWPGVERALEFAWRHWDADRDGVMEGEQHNTYDIEFYGPNTMCGSFYLGALRAAEEMARVLGYIEKADTYRAVFEKGAAGYSEALWNGEFFIQNVRTDIWESLREPVSPETHPDSVVADREPRYQYGPGCLADQLLGDWFARVVGLGPLLPQDQVRAALRAIFDHNWKPDLLRHATVQRVYALNDEAGLLLCTWPNGGRPQYPFPYADEVWTGIEYQVAAHCIYEGLIDEGLAIVKAVRDRHDGRRRNPWDEFECGHHYARAMSSWSLLLALSGCHYDAGQRSLAFAPKIHADDFRCFFSAGTGWGVYSQRQDAEGFHAALRMDWGEVALEELALQTPAGSVSLELDGRDMPVSTPASGRLTITPAAVVGAGSTLVVRVTARQIETHEA